VMLWNLGTLPPGQAVAMTLPPTTANSLVSGELIAWKASVTEDGGSLLRESVTLPVDNAPAFTVAIDEDRDPVPVGGTLRYAIRYGNRLASDNATGTTLRFALPAGTSFVSATGGGTASGGEVSWSLGTLDAGALGQQVVEVTVDGGVANGTLLESEAVISGIVDFVPTERRATSSAYVAPSTPLSLVLAVKPLPALANQQTLVTLLATNTSGAPVFGGVVQLHYPVGMNFIGKGLVTGPFDGPNSCNGAGSISTCDAREVLLWDLGTLAPGQKVEMSLPPRTLNSLVNGQLIPWKAIVTEDSGSLRSASVTLPIGVDALGDPESDTIGNTFDNCTEVENTDQRDTDWDGFGNTCDPDFNNNGIVDPSDFSRLKSRFGSTTAPDEDLNGNGIVDPSDFSRLKAFFGQPPGPSGLVP